jgi:hypothetical protein
MVTMNIFKEPKDYTDAVHKNVHMNEWIKAMDI